MFSLLYSPVDTLLWLNFPVWVLVNPVFNWSISFLVSFAHQVNLLYFLFFGIFWLYFGVSLGILSVMIVFVFLSCLLFGWDVLHWVPWQLGVIQALCTGVGLHGSSQLLISPGFRSSLAVWVPGLRAPTSMVQAKSLDRRLHKSFFYGIKED